MRRKFARPGPSQRAVTSEPRQSATEAPSTKALLTFMLRALTAQGLLLYLLLAIPAQRTELLVLAMVLIVAQLLEGWMRALGKANQAGFLLIVSVNFASAYATYLTGGLGSPLLPWVAAACIASLSSFGHALPKLAVAWGATLLGAAIAYLLHPSLPEIPSRTATTLLIACPLAALAYLLASTFIRRSEREKRRGRRSFEEVRLEQLADEAESADKQTTNFFVEANHAIRTPLNAIIGYSEMILEDGGNVFNEDNLGDVQRIQEASSQMLKLVSDVFDLSEIENGQKDSAAFAGKAAQG